MVLAPNVCNKAPLVGEPCPAPEDKRAAFYDLRIIPPLLKTEKEGKVKDFTTFRPKIAIPTPRSVHELLHCRL